MRLIYAIAALISGCTQTRTHIPGLTRDDRRGTNLEGAVLGERVSRESGASRGFGDFNAHSVGIGSALLGGAQNCVLAEDFAVNLGDEIVLPVHVTTPNLAELYGFDCHRDHLPFWSYVQSTRAEVRINGQDDNDRLPRCIHVFCLCPTGWLIFRP